MAMKTADWRAVQGECRELAVAIDRVAGFLRNASSGGGVVLALAGVKNGAR